MIENEMLAWLVMLLTLGVQMLVMDWLVAIWPDGRRRSAPPRSGSRGPA